ncbi:high-affinity branched-chain amino acid transport system permease protein LivH [Paenibacillus sp. 32O-W]|uniref:branched-chain amino acid ABC transporter permease n=1 Tax=Paenibacillus sp. 32O-W TaxID=1695218 RepID=UPI00072141B2|nr:branched-chain amino acid ABC transporter permease [Paenibacillus sp. 32O-W]ALS29943.1 high-affinity branched-chain amino acid transport system permease protein LivH [Paenibacillus sp. 32O-W]
MIIIEQLINGLALGGVYSLIALGFTLIFGVLRLFHISHGDVFMFTGYVVIAVVIFGFGHLPFWVVLILAMAIAAVLGAGVERIAFRPYRKSEEIIPLISGIGVSLILQNLAMLIWGPGQINYKLNVGIGDLSFGGIQITGIRIVILSTCILIVLLFNYWLFRTQTGRAIRATASDPQTASMMGIKPEWIILITFTVGSSLAGAATALVGALYGAIYPSLGFSMGLKAFAASILGGLGSMTGAIVGGLLLGILEVFTASYVNVALQDAVAMAIVIGVLLLRPNGILGKSVEEKL